MAKINLQIAYKVDHIPAKDKIQAWINSTLEFARVTEPSTEITLRIVDHTESAKLNQRYRHKAGPTNVLSFPEAKIPNLQSTSLGDLVLCADLVEEEAKQQDISVQDHWAHLMVHGTLHLLGHDHENDKEAAIMEKMEMDILAQFGIASPY